MASLIELAEIANLENWVVNHSGVAQYPETNIEEYEDAVKKLAEKIQEENVGEARHALRKMYTRLKYYQAPVLMSKTEFYEIIDEFADSDFSHLEKFVLFLTTAAKIYHLKKMEEDYTLLMFWYKKIKKTKDDFASIRIVSLLQRRNIKTNFVLYELHKNPTEINRKIAYCKTVFKDIEKEYSAIIDNMIFIPIKNVRMVDSKY